MMNKKERSFYHTYILLNQILILTAVLQTLKNKYNNLFIKSKYFILLVYILHLYH